MGNPYDSTMILMEEGIAVKRTRAREGRDHWR
jgi:hypothetical protein